MSRIRGKKGTERRRKEKTPKEIEKKVKEGARHSKNFGKHWSVNERTAEHKKRNEEHMKAAEKSKDIKKISKLQSLK